MKKISFFLLGALLIGVASAFTTQPTKTQQTAFGFDGEIWHEVQVEDIGVTYTCRQGIEYCLYDQPNGSPLPGLTETEKFVKLN